MNKLCKWFVVLAVVAMFQAEVGAVPVLGEYWGVGLNPDPVWLVTDTGLGNNVTPATASGVSTVILSLPNGGFSPSARMSATGANYVGAGNNNYASLGTALTMTFTFTPSVDPVALQFYFMSGAGDMWVAQGLNLVAGPSTYTFNIGTSGNWLHSPFFNTGMTWDTGFANVTEIGFEVFGQNGFVTQDYQFSNMEMGPVASLSVPEPETVWMIMMVLASLALTFRSRLGELAGQVKARIKA